MLDPVNNDEDWWYLQGGLYRSPYVLPFQHDFRVLARLPAAFQVAPPMHSMDRAEAFVRLWGVLPVDVVGSPDPVFDPDGVVRVEADPERIRWCDSVQCQRAVELATTARVWEVARCIVPDYAIGNVQRVATFLSAQSLNPGGNPVGAPFVTNDQTPLCADVVHNQGNVADLEVRWHLRQHDGALPAPLVAAPSSWIPASDAPDGLPSTWADWRYAWQSIYTEHHKSVLRARVVRLFAELRADQPDRWRVNVGGLLTVWGQAVNPYDNQAARRSVTNR